MPVRILNCFNVLLTRPSSVRAYSLGLQSTARVGAASLSETAGLLFTHSRASWFPCMLSSTIKAHSYMVCFKALRTGSGRSIWARNARNPHPHEILQRKGSILTIAQVNLGLSRWQLNHVIAASTYNPSRRGSRVRQRKPEGLKLKMQPDSREYWEGCLRNLTRSDARELRAMLDLEQVIGVNPEAKGSLPLFAEFCHYKKEYPQHLIVIKIGSFYETVGVDAVMLVEHAGLNAMSKHSGVPRAGFPAVNLPSMLNRLVTENGFSVVVVEQEAASQASKQQLRRYVGGIVTPAKPHYIHGMLQTMGHEVYDVVKPIIGLASTKNGYQVLELRLDSYVLTVHEGLNEEALVAHVHASGVAPPLYVHSSVFTIKHGNNFEERLRGVLVSDLAGSMRKFMGHNVVDGLLNIVRHEHGIDSQVHIEQVKSSAGRGPRPLYMSTVNQMGLNPTVKYVPPLLDRMVQLTEKPLNKPSRLWLRRLLLCPPPLPVAAAVRQVCHILKTTPKPMPIFVVTMPPNQIIDMLTQQEATASFFRDLTDMLDPVHRTVLNRELRDISEAVLEVVAHDRGVTMTPEAVGECCQQAIDNVAAVIAAEQEREAAAEAELPGLSEDSSSEGDESRDEDQIWGTRSSDAVMSQVRRIWERNLRGNVQPSLLEEEMREVEITFAEVSAVVRQVLDPMITFADNHAFKEREMPRCIFDSDVEALRVIIPGNTKLTQQAIREALQVKLELCKDGRRNARKSERYKSRLIDDAFLNYAEAVQAAQAKVRAVLRELAQQLHGCLNAQLVSVQFAIILNALTAHVSSATRLNWCLPQAGSVDMTERGNLVVEGMWPYWWGTEESSTPVKNNISLDSMVLLTGPNMAGKSTVLRTLCAVALLGSCGLMAPAQRAVVPFIDAFVLRNFSGDSPVEKKSAFALEMHEMRFVLEDVTPRSLVLVDELGKGTDHDSGEAISGAILEDLDRSGCRGVFATHFHGLVDLKESGMLNVPNTQLYQMEVDTFATPDGVETQPTFCMVPGSNSKTLAFSVARNEGLSSTLVQRAYELFHRQDPDRPRPRLLSPELPRSPTGPLTNHNTTALSSSNLPLRKPWQVLDELAQLLESTARVVITAQGPEGEKEQGCSSTNGNGRNGRNGANGLITHVHSNGDGNEHGTEAGSSKGTKRTHHKRIATASGNVIGQDDAHSLGEVPHTEVFCVAAGNSPPSAHLSQACVYVVCWEDGLCHAGETEDIIQRHHQHCTRTRRGYKGSMAMLYIVLPLREGGKSMARQVEAQLTREMRARGVLLKGTGKDAGNTKFARK